ncbi:hypothetical protein IHE44_0005206 [Lamprotornis superbus]|uniref:VWFA domain-containing protein n=1 Tax=Lamprotornis superbus TaxID=245042 RepID=A0A835NWE4_9PASS|nr:hypothetical protein IHE44_0005206 [Lamprotornis superbus]
MRKFIKELAAYFIAGVCEDVFLIWKELEEAKITVRQVQKMLSESEQSASQDVNKGDHPLPKHITDKYLTSEKWLQKYGLKAQKLTLYDALADCVFRHETKMKVIHARYCDKFIHTLWKDGSIVHVYVTTEKYKQYEEKMRTALRQVEGRIKWLQQGSRELFGNVFEDDVYILIDTSQSMKNKLPLVKEKIFQLMQEQLRHKKRFNFVKFSAQAVAWQKKLAEVNEENLQDAWLWIKGLEVGSSTNTLKALQIALADTDTQAIYLLTDGRPDQNNDIDLLKREIDQGEKDLEKVKIFHEKSLMMNSYNKENYPENKSRPCCASEEPSVPSHEQTGQSTAASPARRKKAFYADQTKTSLLRILSQGVKSREESPEERVSPQEKGSVKKDISSALWLKTHGLAARRLTIMDALAPTTVPHSTKYIPVLDKHVVSKVFDKMLPLAHVHSDKKGIALINPRAVNLDAYKEKLEQAIKSYERQELGSIAEMKRLNLVIWRALSQEERDKFKEVVPVQYIQHKEALLEALENLGWPVSYEDVKLLEDEILTALTYIQQASDLQEVVKKEIEKSSESHISNNKKRLEEESGSPKIKTRQKCQIFVTHKSQKVIARSDVTGFYYPGTVIRNISSTSALVDFSNGESCDVPVKFTIPVGGAMPCPHLQVGDYVLARTGRRAENEYYVPAIVIATPERVETGHKLYTVLMFNNREEHCVRSELIKISQTKYASSCQYIRTVQTVDYEIQDGDTTKPCPRPPVEDEGGEEAKKSTVKEKRGKEKKKRTRVDKRHPREMMSDFDNLLSPEVKVQLKEILQSLVKAASPGLLESAWSSEDWQDSLGTTARSKGSYRKGAGWKSMGGMDKASDKKDFNTCNTTTGPKSIFHMSKLALIPIEPNATDQGTCETLCDKTGTTGRKASHLSMPWAAVLGYNVKASFTWPPEHKGKMYNQTVSKEEART